MKTQIEIKKDDEWSSNLGRYLPKKGDRGYIDGYVNQNDGYAIVVIGENITQVPLSNLKVIGLITEQEQNKKECGNVRSLDVVGQSEQLK